MMSPAFKWAALAAALAMAAAAAMRRRRGRASEPQREPRRHLSCSCGQEFVVAGTDRHRVYWLAGAAESDPVLGDSCPVCHAQLPAERAPAAV